jgi:hypothetical protein
MNDERTLPSGRASRALRDKFLNALDAEDYAALRAMCADLPNCSEILPRSMCVSLGLPCGSTYATAAMTIVSS